MTCWDVVTYLDAVTCWDAATCAAAISGLLPCAVRAAPASYAATVILCATGYAPGIEGTRIFVNFVAALAEIEGPSFGWAGHQKETGDRQPSREDPSFG